MIKEYLKQLWQWLLDQTEVDEKVEETIDEIDRRVDRVKEEIADVKEAASEVVDQIDDVAKAVGGSKRRGRKPKKTTSNKVTKTSLRSLTKQELIKRAKKDHNVSLDPKLTKSNLVNKLYELNHKK